MISDITAVRAAHIVLASSSPRRVDILNTLLKCEATVVPSTFPEDLDKSQYTPSQYVMENARQKALEVFHRLTAENGMPPSVVVGADTVIALDDTILEKPKSTDAAVAMLTSLSGRAHDVSTGVALIYAGEDLASSVTENVFVETTHVEFGMLSQDVISAYVQSGEPMDKAGSYGIQGVGGSFVRSINGCYYNVVGFPMHRFCCELDCTRLRERARRQA